MSKTERQATVESLTELLKGSPNVFVTDFSGLNVLRMTELRRRLEECARRLRDPADAARSVTEIAFDCGFTDASYFGRSFRQRYGQTPREFRRTSA